MAEQKSYNFFEAIGSFLKGLSLSSGMQGNIMMQMVYEQWAKFYENLGENFKINIPFFE